MHTDNLIIEAITLDRTIWNADGEPISLGSESHELISFDEYESYEHMEVIS